MTQQKASEILKKHQAWRKGDGEMQIPSEITEALDIVLNHRVETLELPQQEISDEEIEKAADKYVAEDEFNRLLKDFEEGAKWYREQLKQRQ